MSIDRGIARRIHPVRAIGRIATVAAMMALAGCATTSRAQTSPAAAPAAPAAPGTSVLVISDLHFNPFYDPSLLPTLRQTPASQWASVFATSHDTVFSAHGQDTDFPLLRSASAAMKQAVPNPAFVVITGDFLVHSFADTFAAYAHDTTGWRDFADSTMAFMASWAGALYPDVPIYPSIGNNDSDCGDYAPDPHFLASAARSWAPLAQRGGGAPGFAAAFDAGGYYVVHPPAAGVTLVMLNDIYWSSSFDDVCWAGLGAQEMRWLGQVLDSTRAAGGKAWLAAHIPPGVDLYASRHHPQSPTLLMDSAYAAPYVSLVGAHADVVSLVLTGHTHMSEFRVFPGLSGGSGVPNIGIPAVSPIFYNNAGFASLTLGDGGAVTNYTAYALANGQWAKTFDFGSLYGQNKVTAASMRAASQRIQQDPTVRATWEQAYVGLGSPGPTDSNWPIYWCGITQPDPASYAACAASTSAGTQ